MATKKTTDAEPEAPATVTYQDTVYDRRPLYLASGRELQVIRGQITVPADDAEAVEYLTDHAELQLQQAG